MFNQARLLNKLIAVLFGISLGTLVNDNYATSNQSRTQSKAVTTAYLFQTARPLSSNFFCFNTNSLRVKSWQEPKFWQAVNLVNPRMLRIPGGTESNYWDWQRGGLIKNVREAMAGFPYGFSPQDRKYQAGKLENIQIGLEKTNIKPLFVLNLSTSNLASQLAMLRTAKKLGLSVQYIELGNELYLDVINNRRIFPQPEDYGKEVVTWISAIKQEFPEAKIAINGIVPIEAESPRLQNWNQSLLVHALAKADAITLHIYGGHGLKQNTIYSESYPFFSEADFNTILSIPFKRWQVIKNAKHFKLLPPKKKIWITEYNLFENIFFDHQGKKPRVMGSWTHGLYAISMSLLFLEDPRIELICNHELIGKFYFASILEDEKSFINPLDQSRLGAAYNLSATGSALSLLGNATEGMTSAQKINFSKNITLTGNDEFQYPALYGWMFSNGKDKNSIITNLSDRNIEIEISSLFNQAINYETISGSPRDLITKPGILKEEKGSIKETIILPPYSVTKLSSNKD